MAVKVAVIGMDPLGQSLALALKSGPTPLEVVVHDRDRERLGAAAAGGRGLRAEWNLPRTLDGASVIVVNEPLPTLRETLTLIGSTVQHEAVVTDTAPHKAAVFAWADELLPPNVHYVGSTPLVSTEEPDAALFQQKRYAIVARPDTPERALRLLSDVLALTGATPHFLDPVEHDILMSALVALPTLMGTALLGLTTRNAGWRDFAALASAPYRNATTLPHEDASSVAALLHHSREPLLHWLDQMDAELQALRALVAAGDEATLSQHLETTLKDYRRWAHDERAALQNEQMGRIEQAQELGGVDRLFFGGIRAKRRKS